MLVKFISFIITVFGTKRYKPLLLACATLIISCTGISAVAAFSTDTTAPAASTAAAEEQGSSPKDTLTQQAPRKQAPRDDTTIQPETGAAAPVSPATPDSSGNTAPTTQQNTTPADILLSTSKIMVGKNSTSELVKAVLTDNSAADWSVTFTDNVPGAQVNLETSQNTSTLSFTLKTNNTTPAGTYTITVQTKDSAHSTTKPKLLTVVITE